MEREFGKFERALESQNSQYLRELVFTKLTNFTDLTGEQDMKNNKSQFKNSIGVCTFAAYGFLLLSYVLTVLSFACSEGLLILADDSTEWVLANHLKETGRLVSADWCYGTELHVFFTQILNSFLLRLFSDWHVARTISIAVFLAILALSVLWLCRALGMKREFAALAAAPLMIPIGTTYSYFGLYSGFYTFYIALAFIILAINACILAAKADSAANAGSAAQAGSAANAGSAVNAGSAAQAGSAADATEAGNAAETGTKKGVPVLTIILTALVFILAFVSGLNGVRMLIILYIPMLMTAAAVLWISLAGRNEGLAAWLRQKECAAFALILAQSLLSAAGWIFNEKYLSRVYTYWTYKNNNLHTFTFSDFLDYFDSFTYLLGYEGINDFTSIKGLGQVCGLALIVIVLGSYIYCYVHRDRLTKLQRIYVAFAGIAYVSNTLIFYLGQQAEDRFVIPTLCYSLPVTAMALHLADGFERIRMYLVTAVFALCLFVQGTACVYADALVFRRGEVLPEEKAAAWLVENGYERGTATFWNGAVLEYLSSGRVEMWMLDGEKTGQENGLVYREWEQPKDRCTGLEPGGKAFLILSQDENELFSWCTGDSSPVYDDGYYRIYDRAVR